ncbi:hypothetical protein C3L33_19595, partial [Rhododendron williamsianum]
MGSYASQITHEFPPYFLVHKDGRIERLMVPSDYATPAVDPQTGVESKDVVISPETGIKARIFLPKIDGPDQTKLPLLVHFHGGAFCVGSSLDIVTTRFLTHLTSIANAVMISVDYRLAPEHPLPTAYNDSWSALQWIATHLNGKGPELWLNEYVDYGRIFLTGSSGMDSYPKLNPKADPDLDKMSCEKVLVFVGEKYWMKSRGVEYCETLKNSGWKGNVELVENEGEKHVFYVLNPSSQKALVLMQKLASFVPSAYAPPAVDPQTGIESKDVLISPDTRVKARIFLPKIDGLDKTKLPLLVHYHGGAFCVGSSLDIATTRFLNILTSVANAITWIATHLNGKGPELWLNEYVDFGRIFLMGDSAGSNIAHHMAVRVGATGLEGFKVSGAVIVHPYFAVSEPDKMIQFLYPGSSGTDSDPKLNPKADPDLDKMGCEKVLVFVAEKDWLKSRGVEYCETLKNSGWKGSVELVENEGEDHVFYKLNPTCEKALLLMQKLASFVNQA